MPTPRKKTSLPAAKPVIKPAAQPATPEPKADLPERKPEAGQKIRLKLVGIGGAGGNTVSHISSARAAGHTALAGVEIVALNTDVQAVEALPVTEKIAIGASLTHGLGAGGDMEVGARAAQADAERIQAALQGADVVFITAGFGGGTGTGASPVVARLAKEQGALVLVFAAMPFAFEGERRQQQALAGLDQVRQHADAVISIPNDKLFKIMGDAATAVDAFARCDAIIGTGVQAVWQLVSRRGLINLDFADIRATLGGRHADGLFSHGEADGQNKARDAVKRVLENPLIDGGDALARSEAVLVSILGGPDLTLGDVQRAVEPVTRLARRAKVVMGAAIDESYRGRIAVTVIAATPAAARKFAGNQPPRIAIGRTAIPLGIPVKPATSATPPTPQPVITTTTEPRTETADKKPVKPKQEQLGLGDITRGRFDKGEPTLYDGEDLDVPTFIRRGIALKR